jgi:hypothetical protein
MHSLHLFIDISLICGISQGPPLIVPRVMAEVSGRALMVMLQRPGDAIALMVDEVEKHGFDGLVGVTRSC